MLLKAPIDTSFTESVHDQLDRCYIHADRETGLLCTQCEHPICVSCMVPAPVGQLCLACARQRRPVNYRVSARTLLLAIPITVLMSLAISILAVWVLTQIIFFAIWITLLVAPRVGRAFVRVLDRVTRAKRGQTMQQAIGASIAAGSCPALLLSLVLLDPTTFLLALLFIIVLIATVTAELR